MNVPLDAAALARRFDAPDIVAIALMGSYARGDAGPYSDVDLVRFADQEGARPDGDGSYLSDGRLVVVSTHTPASVARVFHDPEAACQNVLGLAAAQPLIDREDYFAAIQAQARSFQWDAAMQGRANRAAADLLVGWIEEAHKGMEGLRRDDTGRLLNAQFGLSWGLSRVVMVQRGVLLAGDNDAWNAINRAVGAGSTWVRLRHAAFGLAGTNDGQPLLHSQVRAGLALYVETVALMDEAMPEAQRALILATCATINAFLEGARHGAA